MPKSNTNSKRHSVNIAGRRCFGSIEIRMRIIPNDTKVFILVRKGQRVFQ